MGDNLEKIQLKFNDFDQYAEVVNQGNIEHFQLVSGNFEGELTQIKFGPIIISTHKMNLQILQIGTGIEGYTTFLIPGNMEQDFRWRKRKLRGNVIGILKTNTEHNCVTFSNFYATPVSIENNFLIEMSEILGYSHFNKYISNNEVITINENSAKRIHQMVTLLCERPIIESSLLTFDLPKLIVESIMLNESQNVWTNVRGKGQIFKNAQEYIHKNIEEPLKITSLCNSLKVSERNLRYAFKEQVGISPKKYIQNYKLNMVRKLLRSGKVEKIKDAANQMGFWHTGQFAIDYNLLFGELPSQSFK